jgi:hypothetical protein
LAEPGPDAALRAAYIRAVQSDAPAVHDFASDETGALTAENPAQRVRARVDLEGLELTPHDAPWRCQLSLAAIGRGRPADASLNAVEALEGTVVMEANRASVGYAQGLEEWYENGPLGVEHGVVIDAPPAAHPRAGTGAGDVVLVVAVGGDLVPEAEAGDAIVLRDASGAAVLRYTDLFVVDADGKPLAAAMTAVAQGIAIRIDDDGARYPVEVDPLLWTEVKKLGASDAADNDFFGMAVAVSGDVAIVGAPSEDGAGVTRGAAYVFERGFGGFNNWGQRKKLTASDAQDLDSLGGAVAISGDIAVVGAAGEDGAGTNRGAAYVFERHLGGADNWGQRKKLGASDAGDNDWFGSAVAVDGDLVIVGAPEEDSVATNAGAAYVFERDLGGADNWGERRKVTSTDSYATQFFGNAVAIAGDLAIVGAFRWDDDSALSIDIGAAFVFERDLGGADNWGARARLLASDAETNDELGTSVAIDGDIAVVGARLEDGAGFNRGAAYVFERDHGGADSWGQRKKLISPNAQDHGLFGVSVELAGDVCVVGAYHEFMLGYAYVFERDEGGADQWGSTQTLTASDAHLDDDFGRSVAADARTIVVGAPLADAAGTNRGGVYVLAAPALAGEPCTMASQCESGFCVDGVCCTSACAGGAFDCQACSVAAGASADGTCGPRPDGDACSDGAYCNGGDTCQAGGCTVHAGDPCAANVGDADGDCTESCNEAADACTAADPNGSSCTDGAYCNGSDTCSGGNCSAHSGDPCAANVGDADADCSESCDEATDACTAADPNGSSCTDGAYCNGSDTCSAGSCSAHSGDPCAANVGDADGDCSESCDEAADACTAQDPDGSACSDDVFCNGADSCATGACGDHAGDPCAGNVGDADADCSESCDELADACSLADPGGSACDDGVSCNGADACDAAGSCTLHDDECGGEGGGGEGGAGGDGGGAGGTAGSGGAGGTAAGGAGGSSAGGSDSGGVGGAPSNEPEPAPAAEEAGCTCVSAGRATPASRSFVWLAALAAIALRRRAPKR